MPDTMPNGGAWPRISIVTPSYQQGQFIEETIRSVLLQAYPNLEYIVIDGGSTDQSDSIIRKYEPWLTYWVSENDRGQSHAINKGFAKATGEILAWLNSDDLMAPGAIHQAIEPFSSERARWVVGAAFIGGAWGNPARRYLHKTPLPTELKRGKTFLQPSSYFTRDLYLKCGPLNEALHFAMDYDLWSRFMAAGEWPVFTGALLSLAREQPQMKSRAANSSLIQAELNCIIRRNLGFAGFWGWRFGALLKRLSQALRRLVTTRITGIHRQP